MNAIFTDTSFQNMLNIANKYGISSNAVTDLTHCLMNSNGTMAQFYIPELGGGGQWMLGGMTMVGDMFNYQLKATVDGLCVELSNLINQGAIQYKPLPKPQFQEGVNTNDFSGNWWGDLGYPNSTGSQNGTSYAIFNNINRLAIQQNGKVTVFNTLDHNIGGVGQQQGGSYSVTFSSQYGNVDLNALPIVSGEEKLQEPQEIVQPIIESPIKDTNSMIKNEVVNKVNAAEEDIFDKIERLAGLKDKGILSENEFDSKKIELLSRL